MEQDLSVHLPPPADKEGKCLVGDLLMIRNHTEKGTTLLFSYHQALVHVIFPSKVIYLISWISAYYSMYLSKDQKSDQKKSRGLHFQTGTLRSLTSADMSNTFWKAIIIVEFREATCDLLDHHFRNTVLLKERAKRTCGNDFEFATGFPVDFLCRKLAGSTGNDNYMMRLTVAVQWHGSMAALKWPNFRLMGVMGFRF